MTTRKQATANAQESIAWGTKIVGGVTPGRTSEHLGLPVLPSVRKAVEELKPDATGIYVAAHQAPAAIEEAIEAEVPLIVAVAEHIPLHDMLRIHSILKTQSASRLVGANSPGIISAVGKCRIGFQPLPCFSAGRVGIIAKSGTLSYEAVASTTRAGLGQSLCVGVGGDILPGTDLTEALSVLENDEDTDAIALIGEIGGKGEIEAAEWIKEYHARTKNPKPIVALIAGVNEARGRIMGHAGAFTLFGEPEAKAKIEALKAAGATMVHHPAKFGDALRERLQGSVGDLERISKRANRVTQQRGLHTAARPSNRSSQSLSKTPGLQQRRNIYLSEDRCFDLLRQESGINAGQYSGKGERRYLAIGIDRSRRSPCIIAAPSTDPDSMQQQVRRFPFDYRAGVKGLEVDRIASHLGVSWSTVESLREVIKGLVSLFYAKEAFLLETKIVERLGGIKIVNANFGFDDAAFRSNKRQEDIQALRDSKSEDPAELEAEKNGIVYIKLEGDGKIGTLVNGAGLAMNTVDALAEAGGRAANFLDTGGKATSETVKKSFEVILQDPRVNVIFVNIFGGLTLGDMIARGVILAFKETAINVPVVVRIRGTNEEEGQKIIAESGLPLFAFDDFDEAAAKAIDLSQG
ncbi:putative succinyl- ligase alpha-chain protein [Phaeoacremonium minimum UCRPA7]|uniref:Putative succinyl-ligase alpha-chain protein n=1 Tax=Phaeoacremonium minimum (strain UCR-PA7) TaxID=1286976 RepID=R8BCC4_PHAM7|nr:putative succinyl- ligase alpha-chain protein [Phaeoacremonium minimum UCRPA7]EON96947.1 putative succinyl- ligase alpha-chain protein [Phaeoacremonium minimum UCRPA7]